MLQMLLYLLLFRTACPIMLPKVLASLWVLPFTCAMSPGQLPAVLASKRTEPSLERRQDATQYPAHAIEMPIDHFPHNPRYAPHTNATFSQRYYFDSTYYQPGGPVYLYIGGETSGPSRFSNLETGIIQILMNATHGLGVILENRYYGESFPYESSTTDQLAYLTTEQTIADNAYFASHATFPGIKGNLSAPNTPWILYGGSLAGAQTAFSVKQYGGLLYGGIASSAVIHAVLAYPEWYAPIQKFAPQDCVTSINNIIDKFDALVAENNTEAIEAFKAIFGLEALIDDRDFAMTIAFPIGGPLNYPVSYLLGAIPSQFGLHLSRETCFGSYRLPRPVSRLKSDPKRDVLTKISRPIRGKSSIGTRHTVLRISSIFAPMSPIWTPLKTSQRSTLCSVNTVMARLGATWVITPST